MVLQIALFLLGLCLGAISVALMIAVDQSQLSTRFWNLIGPVAPLVPPALGMGLLYLLVPPTAPASISYGLLIGWVVGVIGSVEYVKKHWPQLIPMAPKKEQG